jgi:protocatechuate 3,4-dioxygenase alpha subunit
MTDTSSLTPSQTVGPFLHIALHWPSGHLVVPEGTPGAIRIAGTLYDGAGAPVPDGLVEIWQADAAGRFTHPDDLRGDAVVVPEGFRGFGRCPTDADGRFEFLTVQPGALPVPGGGLQAPHLDVSVFARGLLDRVVTRLYLPGEAAANALDPVLSAVDEARRATLVAVPDGTDLVFDIHLQGHHETVFFAV